MAANSLPRGNKPSWGGNEKLLPGECIFQSKGWTSPVLVYLCSPRLSPGKTALSDNPTCALFNGKLFPTFFFFYSFSCKKQKKKKQTLFVVFIIYYEIFCFYFF